MVLAGLLAVVAAVTFVALAPLPLVFPGSSLVLAALLAGMATVSFAAWMPEHWLWSEDERLAHAFKSHHALTAQSAETALSAISEAHRRAENLRSAAQGFHPDLKPAVLSAADRLDASAREIFYDPSRLRALRAIVNRSELIEDATRAHKALRARSKGQGATLTQSRETLLSALGALEEAFATSDLRVGKGHFDQVKIASSVAETLLRPRQPIQRPNEGEPI